MIKNQIKAIIAAGGTGGHLFPALAVAEEFKAITNGDFEAYFVGNPNRLESKIVPDQGYSFSPIPITGFRGVFTPSTISLPYRIFKSVLTVRNLIKKNKPDFVLCTGAYLSFPAGLAAKQMGIPLVLMESNVFPGKTIKLLSPKADLIITTFEESTKYFPEGTHRNIKCLGNPLRKMFDNMPSKEEARGQFGLEKNKTTILIFGGSLGARAINQAARTAFEQFKTNDVQFIWQTGNDFKLNSELPANVKMLKFIDNMATAYAAADLVVARSGATTVAELCYTAKPSILIPLPSASNNEQASNAEELTKQGAAILIDNSEVGAILGGCIRELIEDKSKLEYMAKAADKLAKRDAAEKSVNEIIRLIK